MASPQTQLVAWISYQLQRLEEKSPASPIIETVVRCRRAMIDNGYLLCEDDHFVVGNLNRATFHLKAMFFACFVFHLERSCLQWGNQRGVSI